MYSKIPDSRYANREIRNRIVMTQKSVSKFRFQTSKNFMKGFISSCVLSSTPSKINATGTNGSNGSNRTNGLEVNSTGFFNPSKL